MGTASLWYEWCTILCLPVFVLYNVLFSVFSYIFVFFIHKIVVVCFCNTGALSIEINRKLKTVPYSYFNV
jgi:hypothetical protein